MAVARVTVFRGLEPGEARRLVTAVHDALVQALQVPDDDPTVWVTEQAPEHARLPSDRGPGMTFVQVTLFSGRSHDTKHRLHEALATNLEAAGTPRSSVLVVLVEAPPHDWSIAGTPQDQVDVGFRIDI
jgi:phenylpyruvate tautomerase PptA (4-oxalocrotonate tautomerase family)